MGSRSMAKGSFGELLKRERELREITLNELTVATRVAPKFLEALENEDWAKLPGGVFNRGFVRAIARYLGLSEEHILAEYDLAHAEHAAPLPPATPNPIPSPSKWIVAAGLLALLVVIAALVSGGIYGWRRYIAHRAAKHALAAADPTQITLPAMLPNLIPDPTRSIGSLSPALDLALSTSAPTHVRIVADGKPLLDDSVPAGTTRHFSAANQFEVTTADSTGVLLELNGQAIPAPGRPGTSGTIVLSQRDLRQARSGNP
ncbi:MAG TPA: RodZ domain-containing protein [Candidatus Eisenbacteria bacterium]|nr:RodZ domain-containing protein [Candidatus Eisenbacteria bacterium]